MKVEYLMGYFRSFYILQIAFTEWISDERKIEKNKKSLRMGFCFSNAERSVRLANININRHIVRAFLFAGQYTVPNVF